MATTRITFSVSSYTIVAGYTKSDFTDFQFKATFRINLFSSEYPDVSTIFFLPKSYWNSDPPPKHSFIVSGERKYLHAFEPEERYTWYLDILRNEKDVKVLVDYLNTGVNNVHEVIIYEFLTHARIPVGWGRGDL